MKRLADAGEILERLLVRHERRTGGRRVVERPTQSFGNPEELRTLIEILSEAERTGGVELVWDRDAPHLLEQVILVDPDPLYKFIGRTRPQEILAASVGELEEMGVGSETARAMVDDFKAAWQSGTKLVGIGPNDAEAAKSLVRAMDAAFTDLGRSVPLRTRSARLLEDSKSLERALPAILAYLRQTGIIAPDLPRENALEQLGLAKFAQSVLVAGGLAFAGMDISRWAFAGVPPELAGSAEKTGEVRSILTIENLESFNRHVRDCRLPGDIVVYTGGFPSRAVLSLLRTLTDRPDSILHHWGDIDPGGVRIGRHLETSLEVAVVPHLMSLQLVRKYGRKPSLTQLTPSLPPESSFSEIADYLRTPEAFWLEQEVIDPQVLAPT